MNTRYWKFFEYFKNIIPLLTNTKHWKELLSVLPKHLLLLFDSLLQKLATSIDYTYFDLFSFWTCLQLIQTEKISRWKVKWIEIFQLSLASMKNVITTDCLKNASYLFYLFILNIFLRTKKSLCQCMIQRFFECILLHIFQGGFKKFLVCTQKRKESTRTAIKCPVMKVTNGSHFS